MQENEAADSRSRIDELFLNPEVLGQPSVSIYTRQSSLRAPSTSAGKYILKNTKLASPHHAVVVNAGRFSVSPAAAGVASEQVAQVHQPVASASCDVRLHAHSKSKTPSDTSLRKSRSRESVGGASGIASEPVSLQVAQQALFWFIFAT